MKKRIVGLLLLVTLMASLFVSCASTAEKAADSLARGNYRSAISQALEALGDDPGDEDAIVVLNDAWSRANYEWTASIDEFEKSSDPAVIAEAFDKYYNLIEIHKMLDDSGRTDFKTDFAGLTERYNITKKRVANFYFEDGKKLMLYGERSKSRDALAYFKYVKNLMPDYPNIDVVMDEAKQNATARVVLFVDSSDSEYEDEIISSISEKIAENDLIDVVATTHDINFSSMEAKDFAFSKDANVMIFLNMKVATDTKGNAEERPINARITSAPNWKVFKFSLISSGSCNVNYQILDLQSDKILKEGDLDIDDSTDFGFSISLIGPLDIETERLQINDLKSQDYEVATYQNDANYENLALQLALFEKMEIKNDASNSLQYEPMSYEEIDFDQYETPKELIYKSCNDHKVFLFDIIDLAYVEESVSQKYFFSYLGESYSFDPADRVEAARMDRKNFRNLVKWLNSKDTVDSSSNLFWSENLLPKASEKIASELAGVLK